MKVIIIDYPHGREALLVTSVALVENGSVEGVAPNGMTHRMSIKNVEDIIPVVNSHNLKA